MEKGHAENSDGMVWVNIAPEIAGLRSEPRYAALLKKMGLPQ